MEKRIPKNEIGPDKKYDFRSTPTGSHLLINNTTKEAVNNADWIEEDKEKNMRLAGRIVHALRHAQENAKVEDLIGSKAVLGTSIKTDKNGKYVLMNIGNSYFKIHGLNDDFTIPADPSKVKINHINKPTDEVFNEFNSTKTSNTPQTDTPATISNIPQLDFANNEKYNRDFQYISQYDKNRIEQLALNTLGIVRKNSNEVTPDIAMRLLCCKHVLQKKGGHWNPHWDETLDTILPSYTPKVICNGKVKQGKPMSFDEADNGKTNPEYDEWGDASNEPYHINCQSCVPAMELRIRGYEVSASPNWEDTKNLCYELSYNSYSIWCDKTGKPIDRWDFGNPEIRRFVSVRGKSSVVGAEKWLRDIADKTPDGARFQLGIVWKSGRGHTMMMFKDKDKGFYFYDSQINKKYYPGTKEMRGFLENIDFSNFLFSCLRIDDKLVNPLFVVGKKAVVQ